MQIDLSQEQMALLCILKDYLLGQPSVVKNTIDYSIVKSLADKHQVTPMVYYQTKNPIFYSTYISQLSRSVNFSIVVNDVKEALAEQNYILIKGIVVADLYQVPELRTMGDVDILVHTDDVDKINALLVKAGFQFYDHSDGEWQYIRNGFLVEIHDSLVHRREELSELVESFSNVWDYVYDGYLDWSYHLIYILEHLRHHFVSAGVGFRQFMDVAIICKKCDIDWEFVLQQLKKNKLYDFAMVVFSLIKRWFDVTPPFDIPHVSEDFYLEATQKIFNNGVFGFEDEENQVSKIVTQMHYKGTSRKKAEVNFFLNTLFPKYEEMSKLRYCSYVRRSKLLLPVAWTHRICFRLFNNQSRNNVKQQLSEEKIEERLKMLKRWGL